MDAILCFFRIFPFKLSKLPEDKRGKTNKHCSSDNAQKNKIAMFFFLLKVYQVASSSSSSALFNILSFSLLGLDVI